MSASRANADAPIDDVLVFTRTVNAPLALVWKVWTSAEHLAHWWGPKGFRMGTVKLDIRAGGSFHYSMISPEGAEMWGRFDYTAVHAPTSLSFINGFSDAAGNYLRHPMSPTWPLKVMNHLTLAASDGGTVVTLRGQPFEATDEERATFAANKQNVQQGLRGMFENFDEYLASLQDREMVLTRVVQAPRDLVWKVWTEPTHLARWFGPRAVTVPECTVDLRVGGTHHITMRLPDGVDYPIRGVYREITAPSRLQVAYDLTEHPPEFHRMWREAAGAPPDAPPVQILTTVDFEAVGPRETRLTITQRFDSVADRDANVSLGATAGWNESFEKMDELLAAL